MKLWADGSLHFIFNPMKNFFLSCYSSNFSKLLLQHCHCFFFLLFFFTSELSCSPGINRSDSCVCHCTSGVPVSPLLCSLWGELVLFWIPLSVWSRNSVFHLHYVQQTQQSRSVWPWFCLQTFSRSPPQIGGHWSVVRPPTLGGTVASSVWKASEALWSSGACCFSLAPLRWLWKVETLPCKPATVHLWFSPKFWIWYEFVRRGVAPARRFHSF